MKKVFLFITITLLCITLTSCTEITEEEANVILSDTLEALKGSETAVFEVITGDIDKLVVLNNEEYYDTLLLDYNTDNYDYRYIRYLPIRTNTDGEQLYYSLYYECVETPNCTPNNVPTLLEVNSLSDESLFLEGERDEYVYLKGQDNHFDFYQFIYVAQGVIEYARRDTENNIVIENLEETVFTGTLLGEEISKDTYTFTIYVKLDELLLNEPELLQAMYWLDDVSDIDLADIEQEITLEVERDTNKLVTFSMNQNFINLDDTSVVPFANDFSITLILFKNGQEAIDYITSEPTLVPTEITLN